ncbi:MAG: IclR family transcriptional regulator [Trueperaceae bacterium]
MDRTQARKTVQTSQTADRALAVLRTLLVAGRPISLSEIARSCGLAPSTTHRLLASLQRHNFARQIAETSKYTLGLGLLEYGYAILNGLDVREHAATALASLNRTTRETIHLAILDEFDLVYVDRRDSEHGIRVHTSIGRRGTPHTTGVGKALLAFLPEAVQEEYLSRPLACKTARSVTDPDVLRAELRRTRERGFAIDDGEDKEHVRCVAAPILGPDGSPLAAISVSVPDTRYEVDQLIALAPLVLEQTRTLSRSIGFRSAPDGRFG